MNPSSGAVKKNLDIEVGRKRTFGQRLLMRLLPVRAPDLVVGNPAAPYLKRWHLVRWRGWQLALHLILRSDDDRALHDHIGDNISIILSPQGYEEIVGEQLEIYDGVHRWQTKTYVRYAWRPYFRRAEMPHRLVINHGPVWTLWLRWPRRRQWGFWCPKGWRYWREYASEEDGASTVGRGCD